jgi:DNA-binding transcriptional LysR family regulator
VAGEVMLEEAQRILAAIDRARERMHEVTSGAVGRIRLGATATPGLYLLPPLLTAYRAAHPAFDLEYQIGSVDEISERVIRNDLDMAVITGHPPTTELRSRPLIGDELVAIAAAGTPARAARRRLDGECWIFREEKSTTRRQVDAWLDRHGIAPAQSLVFDGPDAVKRAVMAGLGISIVSKLTVSEELAAGRLVLLDVGLTLPKRDVCAIDHRQKHHGAACNAMFELFARKFSPNA